jgi:hypothetical protein
LDNVTNNLILADFNGNGSVIVSSEADIVMAWVKIRHSAFIALWLASIDRWQQALLCPNMEKHAPDREGSLFQNKLFDFFSEVPLTSVAHFSDENQVVVA